MPSSAQSPLLAQQVANALISTGLGQLELGSMLADHADGRLQGAKGGGTERNDTIKTTSPKMILGQNLSLAGENDGHRWSGESLIQAQGSGSSEGEQHLGHSITRLTPA